MLLECSAVNALCAGESFPSSWPQALISSALMNFCLVFYRDLLLRREKQCRHYLIPPGNIHESSGGAGIIITQPVLQMSEIKLKVKRLSQGQREGGWDPGGCRLGFPHRQPQSFHLRLGSHQAALGDLQVMQGQCRARGWTLPPSAPAVWCWTGHGSFSN